MSAVKTRHITIVRSGDATALVAGSHHCGTVQYCKALPGYKRGAVLPIKWTITAVCGPDSLDGRGFAFDQAGLEELIHDAAHRHVHDSCERLALDVARDFVSAVCRENPRLETGLWSATVEISPAPYLSTLSVTLVAGEGNDHE